MSLLEVKNLQTRFYTRDGVVRAVEDVSFEVEAGETLAVVGESGCGKSVTALSIMRLIRWPPGRIDGGQILFQGRDLRGLPEAEMRQIRGGQIGMIFQEPMTSLNPVLTIEQQIGEAVQLHLGLTGGEARRRVRDLLAAVEIADPGLVARRFPHQLSGGMRQRVMIAMALAGEPKLLIADEPTTALDVTIQAQIVDLIQRAARTRGMAVIMITHNLGVVAGMADRVVVMYAGRVVEVAALRDLYYQPRHPYTVGLLRSIPRIDRETSERLVPIEGQPPDLINPPLGCAFAARCFRADETCWQTRPPLVRLDAGHWAACWHPVEAPHPLPPPPRGGEGSMEGDGAGVGDGDGPNPRSPFPRREGGTRAGERAEFEHGPSHSPPLPRGEGQGEGGPRATATLNATDSGKLPAFVPSPVATGEGQGEGRPLSRLSRGFVDFVVQSSPDARHLTPDTWGGA